MQILLVERRTLITDCLAALLRSGDPDGRIVFTQTVTAAMGVLEDDTDLDIVLADYAFAGGELAMARELTRRRPDVKVVFLVEDSLRFDAELMSQLGVRGLIPKTVNGAAFLAALRLVDCGAVFYPPELMRARNAAAAGLSEREQMIVAELRKGRTNKMIAQRLGLEPGVVKNLIRSAGLKLGARTRTEIAVKSLDLPMSWAPCAAVTARSADLVERSTH